MKPVFCIRLRNIKFDQEKKLFAVLINPNIRNTETTKGDSTKATDYQKYNMLVQ